MRVVLVALLFALVAAAAAFRAAPLTVPRAVGRGQPSMVANPPQPVQSTTYDTEGFEKNVMKTYGRYQLAVDRGEGCYVFDTDGKKYLDMAAGIATCCLGHGDERLVKAVSEQMKKLHHVSNLYYIPEQGELARRLVERSCMDRVFFCNSGAEANEAAIKLARKYKYCRGVEDPVIITALNSFHGRTLAAITATGQPKYQKGFGPMVPGFEYTPYNDADALRELVAQVGDRLAAIHLEPLQGEGGITPGTKEFFAAARELCDKHDALLTVDEVQTGVGRTGKFWAYEHLDVEPDVLCSAKALGGGVPIGAMLCKHRADVFEPGDHASTYGGNLLACAAGNAVMRAFEEDGLLENVVARGEQLRTALDELESEFSCIKEVRGWGLIVGIQLTEDCGFSAGDLTAAAMRSGMLTVPAGPKVLRLVPPLVVSADEIDEAVARVRSAIAELLPKD